MRNPYLRPVYSIWHYSPPVVLLLIHLVSIFLFACAYCLIPGDFYQSTTTKVPGYRHDKQVLETHLREDFNAWIGKLMPGQGLADIPLLLLDVQPNQSVEGLILNLAIELPDETAAEQLSWLGSAHLTAIPLVAAKQPTDGDGEVLYASLLLESRGSAATGGDQGADGATTARTLHRPLRMPLSVASSHVLNDLLLAQQGIPKYLSDSFARMYYFSAVTSSTIGYGDIVPLTTRARLLVALEGTLSMITGGLFLAFLAKALFDLAETRKPKV